MAFYLSKLLWVLFNPFNFFIFIFIVAFSSFLLKKYKYCAFFFTVSFFYLLSISIFPFGNYLTFLLEKKYHEEIKMPDKIDGILILAGPTNPSLSNEYKQIIVNDSSERLIESVRIIKKYKNITIVFSGGYKNTKEENVSHTKVAKKFFDIMGLNTNNIIFEDKSRNTYENIINSQKIVKPKKNEKWILITSAFHMNRSLLIAEKNNWKFIPYAVDFKLGKKFYFKPSLNLFNNLKSFQRISHEWIGLISYYFLGRIDKIY